jgi:hypothetical protein
MTDNFERLTLGTAQIVKCIQRIKKHDMYTLGLKGTHVMCLYYLSVYPDGLTATELCQHCREDKAGISRILSELEQNGYITYLPGNDANVGQAAANTTRKNTTSTSQKTPKPRNKRRYRAVAVLTEKGRDNADEVNRLIRTATTMGGAGVTDEERKVFYSVLFRIAGNLEKICEELD